MERSLDDLEDAAYEISRQYDTKTFPEQEEFSANVLENLMISATHETASQIGFYRNDIETLARFIAFRETHALFGDDELAQILDDKINIELKHVISKRFDSVEIMLQQIDLLKQDWNKAFSNKSYSKVKKQLRIS